MFPFACGTWQPGSLRALPPSLFPSGELEFESLRPLQVLGFYDILGKGETLGVPGREAPITHFINYLWVSLKLPQT